VERSASAREVKCGWYRDPRAKRACCEPIFNPFSTTADRRGTRAAVPRPPMERTPLLAFVMGPGVGWHSRPAAQPRANGATRGRCYRPRCLHTRRQHSVHMIRHGSVCMDGAIPARERRPQDAASPALVF